jgi:VIT1/CCC1 family predicted Fe2+/Mn2+ transporter
MEYMEQCSLRNNAQKDPFLISTANSLECKLLEDADLAFGDAKMQQAAAIPCHFKPMNRNSPTTNHIRRSLMSLTGGLAILVPFLIMILVSGQLAKILATCLFTMGVALVMTVCSELSPERIALVTGAYAAALVVFVGTNPPSYFQHG